MTPRRFPPPWRFDVNAGAAPATRHHPVSPGLSSRVKPCAKRRTASRLRGFTPAAIPVLLLPCSTARRFKTSHAAGHRRRWEWSLSNSCLRNVDERSRRVGENVIEARPPAIRPDMPESGHNTISDNRPEVGRHVREGVEADRAFDVGRVYVDEVIRPRSRDVRKDGFRKIAMRIEQRDALPSLEILPDEVEKDGALAGAGLADDVKMAAAFVEVEHDMLARNAGAEANLLRWCVHGQNGAGVPCAPQLGRWCGQHPHSREGAPGLHGAVVIVRDDLTAEPPAHCRLVSDHDLFEIVAYLDCTASYSRGLMVWPPTWVRPR
jgi:hypothetical protein